MNETLETIAGKIAALSEAIDGRFDRVDQRFDEIDRRFVKVDQRFDEIDRRFVKVDQRFDEIDRRFVEVDQRFDEVDGRFVEVDQRFAETKAQLGVKIEALDDKISLVYDAVLAQQGHNAVTQAAHDALKNRVADHDVRLLALESRKPEDH